MVGFDEDRGRPIWAGGSSVVCSITPYGLTGPCHSWRATPFTSFASTGQMHPVGPPEGPPLAMPGQQLYDQTGTRAAMMIQVALQRTADIGPQNIDVSVHEVGTWEKLMLERYGQAGRITTRQTNFGPPPGGIWKCTDGYVDIAANAPRHWSVFLDVVGRPENLSDPIYEDRTMRVQLFDLLTNIIADHLSLMSTQDVIERGQVLGLPCAPLYTPAKFLQDIQPAAPELFLEFPSSTLGHIRMPGRPFKASPDFLSFRREAPQLGQHNDDIFIDELGHSAVDLARWRQSGVV